MEKFYELFDWLHSGQAITLLSEAAGSQLTLSDLIDLCVQGYCTPYRALGKNSKGYESYSEVDPNRLTSTSRTIWFRRAEIQSLAARMRGEGAPTAAEVEHWRKQAWEERSAREVVEAELADLRARGGSSALAGIRQMMNGHEELEALRERAEQAEKMASALNLQLTEQAERLRRSEDIAAELRKRLAAYHIGQKPEHQPEAPATGLTFPYATKHLEAMRDAAIEFWRSHDRSKPAPYGIQKLVQTFLAERTGENARKVAELAAAIKPDDLPKT